MTMTIHVSVFPLVALSIVEVKPLNMNGRVGENVTIGCSDWDVWSDVTQNKKYFCYSPCTEDKHIIVKAAFGKTSYKNRIKITNTAEGLFVTFTDLQKSDSYTYYCGVNRVGQDSFIKVNLKVTDGKFIISFISKNTTPLSKRKRSKC